MRGGALALALLLGTTALAAQAPATPAGDPHWHIPPRPASAGPSQRPEAVRLREALARYQAIAAAGGWPEIPAGTMLQAGLRDERVALLRDRLRISGDFSGLPATADAWFFDRPTATSLQSFQRRHALPESGQLDERTRTALNVPVDARIAQLQATLTRWNWLPDDFGPRHLWVNVVTGTLEVVEQRQTVLEMRVIAGHPSRPTPSFQDEIRQIVVNPPWSVPQTIAVEDLLPAQQADPDFFPRLGIRVFRGSGAEARELDPRRIDWQRVNPERFPYRLLQKPGPLNSLGRYKLVMDNPHDIYLHDTPSRRLFDLSSRTLSSGCIRLEQPDALVQLLLEGKPLPAGSLDGTRTRSIALPRPIPVYIVYLTSWVSPTGEVNFRPDVYGRDAGLR
ncbi:MAG: L,D-transpeptidase family protein [Gammaproteobacteria bacterium]